MGVGGGSPPLSNFQNVHYGKQNYKILGIIRDVFVYANFKTFLARLARQSLYIVKYTIPSEKYIAITNT